MTVLDHLDLETTDTCFKCGYQKRHVQ